MMKLPAFKHYQFQGETATVFQDDAKFWHFYIIPGFPKVRLDQNDNPVFALWKFLLPDDAREHDPSLPAGGGYMVFDTELKVSQEQRDEIIGDLQDYVRERWEELKSKQGRMRSLSLGATFQDRIGAHWAESGMAPGARASSTSGGSTATLSMPPADAEDPVPAEEPQVTIGEPLWISGKVTMNAPESAGLVANKVGERPASLIGNNVAAFSLDLTQAGATFMQKTLVGEDGTGASDLTPIQVVYELTMLAKLPPAEMYLKFDTQSVYHAVQELYHEQHNCRDDSFTSETMFSSAIEAGLITVKIDMGGVTDEDLQQMLFQQAMQTTQQLLAEKFAHKERAPMEEWATEEVQETSDEIYRLKQQTEIEMVNFEQFIQLDSSTEYTIAPQATLQTFFRGRDDMDAFVSEVDLDDEFFKTLGLEIRAFANWEEDDIAFVEVEVQYKGDGDLKTNTFTFVPGAIEPQQWDPSIDGGDREYQYRWRVGFEGREPEEWNDWEKTTTRDLNVAVETPGKLQVEVTGVGFDYEHVLDAALVHLRYQDRSNDVEMAGQSVLLAPDRGSGSWSRMLYAPWEKPVEYRVEYLLKSGTTVETEWESTDGPTQNIVITRPDIDVLDVPLVPAGRWDDVIQSVISLRYQDGDYHRDAQYNFKTNDEFKKWAVLLVDPNKRDFEYRILSTFQNGDTQETEWMSRDGDQALPVTVVGPPRLTVSLLGATLDYASTPLVKVDFEYSDPDGANDVESFSLQGAEDVKHWSVLVREEGPRDYRYKLTYFPIEGDRVERDWVVTNTELVIPDAYRIPKVGAQFMATRQNFALAPAVEVNIEYDDAQRNVRERQTLVFTANEPQEWFFPVPDTAPRAYTFTVTWYFADGTDLTTSPVTLEKPVVVIPPPPRPEEG